MYAELILLAFSGLEKGLQLLTKLRAAAQQSGEWTPEQEAQYKVKRDALMAQDHWKVEP